MGGNQMAQEKEVELSIRKVKLKEIKFIQMSSIEQSNKEEATKKVLKLGSDLTDEEIENLNVKDGIKLTKEINDLNGFVENVDFQKL